VQFIQEMIKENLRTARGPEWGGIHSCASLKPSFCNLRRLFPRSQKILDGTSLKFRQALKPLGLTSGNQLNEGVH
jgi:hypothetical protein